MKLRPHGARQIVKRRQLRCRAYRANQESVAVAQRGEGIFLENSDAFVEDHAGIPSGHSIGSRSPVSSR